MKLAVVQHRLRGDAVEDARRLAHAAKWASEQGAEAVFFPSVDALREPDARAVFATATDELPGSRVVPLVSEGVRAQVFKATDAIPGVGERLGPVALLYGDACIDPAVLERTAAERPSVLVLVPRSESDLQAEAIIELAMRLSESAAGLVIVAETTGGGFGEPGHGTSAVILLGDLMAEAYEDDEVLLVSVQEPVPLPESPEPLPEVPLILQQRLAQHEGRRPDPGYLADLS